MYTQHRQLDAHTDQLFTAQLSRSQLWFQCLEGGKKWVWTQDVGSTVQSLRGKVTNKEKEW